MPIDATQLVFTPKCTLYKFTAAAFHEAFSAYPQIYNMLSEFHAKKHLSLEQRVRNIQKLESKFETTARKEYLNEKIKSREDLLKSKKAQESFSKEDLMTERLCQRMISQFPKVDLKRISQSLDKADSTQNFQTSQRILSQSVVGLHTLR